MNPQHVQCRKICVYLTNRGLSAFRKWLTQRSSISYWRATADTNVIGMHLDSSSCYCETGIDWNEHGMATLPAIAACDRSSGEPLYEAMRLETIDASLF